MPDFIICSSCHMQMMILFVLYGYQMALVARDKVYTVVLTKKSFRRMLKYATDLEPVISSPEATQSAQPPDSLPPPKATPLPLSEPMQFPPSKPESTLPPRPQPLSELASLAKPSPPTLPPPAVPAPVMAPPPPPIAKPSPPTLPPPTVPAPVMAPPPQSIAKPSPPTLPPPAVPAPVMAPPPPPPPIAKPSPPTLPPLAVPVPVMAPPPPPPPIAKPSPPTLPPPAVPAPVMAPPPPPKVEPEAKLVPETKHQPSAVLAPQPASSTKSEPELVAAAVLPPQPASSTKSEPELVAELAPEPAPAAEMTPTFPAPPPPLQKRQKSRHSPTGHEQQKRRGGTATPWKMEFLRTQFYELRRGTFRTLRRVTMRRGYEEVVAERTTGPTMRGLQQRPRTPHGRPGFFRAPELNLNATFKPVRRPSVVQRDAKAEFSPDLEPISRHELAREFQRMKPGERRSLAPTRLALSATFKPVPSQGAQADIHETSFVSPKKLDPAVLAAPGHGVLRESQRVRPGEDRPLEATRLALSATFKPVPSQAAQADIRETSFVSPTKFDPAVLAAPGRGVLRESQRVRPGEDRPLEATRLALSATFKPVPSQAAQADIHETSVVSPTKLDPAVLAAPGRGVLRESQRVRPGEDRPLEATRLALSATFKPLPFQGAPPDTRRTGSLVSPTKHDPAVIHAPARDVLPQPHSSPSAQQFFPSNTSVLWATRLAPPSNIPKGKRAAKAGEIARPRSWVSSERYPNAARSREPWQQTCVQTSAVFEPARGVGRSREARQIAGVWSSGTRVRELRAPRALDIAGRFDEGQRQQQRHVLPTPGSVNMPATIRTSGTRGRTSEVLIDSRTTFSTSGLRQEPSPFVRAARQPASIASLRATIRMAAVEPSPQLVPRQPIFQLLPPPFDFRPPLLGPRPLPPPPLPPPPLTAHFRRRRAQLWVLSETTLATEEYDDEQAGSSGARVNDPRRFP
ncbi:uncharacterized protein [Dermacentor andersoni]|uniref:uncharacterized protein n=1 Tax=Dermacentor andersoni TaxID=34620 RepID=UPI002416D7E7|nr:uncharacterized protein C6orf132 homolog [Dermacentor andersoni]